MPRRSIWEFELRISNNNDLGTVTAIFVLVVSSAVLLRDVSARASDVSIEIASFPVG